MWSVPLPSQLCKATINSLQPQLQASSHQHRPRSQKAGQFRHVPKLPCCCSYVAGRCCTDIEMVVQNTTCGHPCFLHTGMRAEPCHSAWGAPECGHMALSQLNPEKNLLQSYAGLTWVQALGLGLHYHVGARGAGEIIQRTILPSQSYPTKKPAGDSSSWLVKVALLLQRLPTLQ